MDVSGSRQSISPSYSGFAATRAERLRLSVAVTKYLGGYAAEAEPQGGSQVAGKPEAFRTERGRAATEPGRAPQRNPVEPHRPRQSRQGTRQGPSRNAAEPPR